MSESPQPASVPGRPIESLRGFTRIEVLEREQCKVQPSEKSKRRSKKGESLFRKADRRSRWGNSKESAARLLHFGPPMVRFHRPTLPRKPRVAIQFLP